MATLSGVEDLTGVSAADDDGVVRLRLLGGFALRGGGVTLGARELGGGRPRQVLEILALNPGHVVSKARLVALLWEGHEPPDATATLESYVSVLRSQIRMRLGRGDVVRTAVGGYVVDRGKVSVDVLDLAERVRHAMRACPAERLELLTAVLAEASAPVLVEEVRHEWADEVRATHRRTYVVAAVSAAEAALGVGEPERALAVVDDALALEPLSEAAWEVRLHALERAGRHVEALRAYAACRAVFTEELGCEPGPLITATAARLLNGMHRGDDEVASLVAAVLRVHEYATVSAGGVGPGGLPLDVRRARSDLEELLARTGDGSPRHERTVRPRARREARSRTRTSAIG